jgi:hypothetical protein
MKQVVAGVRYGLGSTCGLKDSETALSLSLD